MATVNIQEAYAKLKQIGLYDKLVAKGMIKPKNQTGIMNVYFYGFTRKFRVKFNFQVNEEYISFTHYPYDNLYEAGRDAYLITDAMDSGIVGKELVKWLKENYPQGVLFKNEALTKKLKETIAAGTHRPVFGRPTQITESIAEPEDNIQDETNDTDSSSDDYLLMIIDALDSLSVEKVLMYSEMFSSAVNKRMLSEVEKTRALINPELKYTQADMDAQKDGILASIAEIVKKG